MKARTRSLSGALLMLLILPGIVGLLACMPVPIGDPERSRIDPDISGAWYLIDASSPGLYAFEPYDKRTWLLTGMPIEEGPDADFSDYDLGTWDGFLEFIEKETVGDHGATTTELVFYKAWRTRLARTWFMTWEPKAVFENEAFEPEMWFVFRIEKPAAGELHLYMVNGDDAVFKGIDETRRAYERVLKKNVRNPEIYSDEPVVLRRLSTGQVGFLEQLAEEVISYH